MHIVICSERFLFRFGADRVLMILARDLRAAGHQITLMANRFDKAAVTPFVDRVITVPEREGQYLDSNEATLDWIGNSWSTLFKAGATPDLAIVGGWPFFASINALKRLCGRCIFVDFGAVPLDGYTGGMLITQQKLRALRQANLRQASEIVAISEFIRTTQSIGDSGGTVPTRTILLGADHVDSPLWTASTAKSAESGKAVAIAERLVRDGRKIVFNLGRWEPVGYKNSDAAFGIFRAVRREVAEAVMLVLGDSSLDIPGDVADAVFPVGFPDDGDLASLIKMTDVGISVSLWEGFNLPLAEVQWLGGTALAFNLGAHPEVVADPWNLCDTPQDMALKAIQILRGEGLDERKRAAGLQKFRHRFTWSRHLAEYQQLIGTGADPNPRILIDVTSATIDPANTGVIRVTRRLCHQLQQTGDPVFVVWDSSASAYMLPTAKEFAQLGAFNGPEPPTADWTSPSGAQRVRIDLRMSPSEMANSWLLIAELVPVARLNASLHFAKERGFRCAAIFYDAIPLLRPELCNEETRVNHAGYMRKLADCEVVVPISEFSAKCLREFWDQNGINGGRIAANLLPGEFGGTPRSVTAGKHGHPIEILCVSTLEPRKNHRRLIAACQALNERRPNLKWKLTLIGNRYAGASDLAEYVESVAAKDSRIRWLGIVDDETLRAHYSQATFTVYPSLIEGFGLPVLESIWNGRPCICADSGVMKELAAGGGCLTVDVEDEAAISEGIERLSESLDLWQRLSAQALSRPIKSWSDYAGDLSRILTSLLPGTATDAVAWRSTATSGALAPARAQPPVSNHVVKPWPEIIFPRCKLEHWQMNDSEKLGLTALLMRHAPSCSVEIGTYHGGSLSLIAQYSRAVVSIDIDPCVADRVGSLPNVHMVTGPSNEVVPQLLKELSEAGVPVEFILIDADHSAEGVKRDISLVLDYVPLKPLFVLMHDSFNPECRRGMIESDWARSAFCHAVELDFVPGRIVEHSGPAHGELWGGLGMAYFLPSPRIHQLAVGRSSEQMFQALSTIHTTSRSKLARYNPAGQ